MEAVLRQFRKFDKNGDGVITKAELRRVLQALNPKVWTDKNVSQLLCHIDRNGDGLIQFEEFVSWLNGGSHDAEQEKGVIPEEACKAAADVMQCKSRASHSAARAGEFSNVLRLAKEQPEVINMPNRTSGETLLHQAVSQGSAAAVQQLLEMRADPALPNRAGFTAVQLAVRLRDEEVLEVLDAQGCCLPLQLKQAADARTAHRPVSPASPASPTSPERSERRSQRAGRAEPASRESREGLSRGGTRRSGACLKDDSREEVKETAPKANLGGASLRPELIAAAT